MLTVLNVPREDREESREEGRSFWPGRQEGMGFHSPLEAGPRRGIVVDLEGRPVEAGEVPRERGSGLRELRDWSCWFLDVFASVCVVLATLVITFYMLGF